MSLAPTRAGSFLKQLTGDLPTSCRQMTPLSDHCIGIGQAELRTVTVQERMAIEQLMNVEISAHMAHYFSK